MALGLSWGGRVEGVKQGGARSLPTVERALAKGRARDFKMPDTDGVG